MFPLQLNRFDAGLPGRPKRHPETACMRHKLALAHQLQANGAREVGVMHVAGATRVPRRVFDVRESPVRQVRGAQRLTVSTPDSQGAEASSEARLSCRCIGPQTGFIARARRVGKVAA